MSSKDQPYTGPERRESQRRKSTDRRDGVRFEPDSDPRRSRIDRRGSKHDLWERRDT